MLGVTGPSAWLCLLPGNKCCVAVLVLPVSGPVVSFPLSADMGTMRVPTLLRHRKLGRFSLGPRPRRWRRKYSYTGLSGAGDWLVTTGTHCISPSTSCPLSREFGVVPLPYKLQCQHPLMFGVDQLFSNLVVPSNH